LSCFETSKTKFVSSGVYESCAGTVCLLLFLRRQVQLVRPVLS
jgi:hypothetical protein